MKNFALLLCFSQKSLDFVFLLSAKEKPRFEISISALRVLPIQRSPKFPKPYDFVNSKFKIQNSRFKIDKN